MKKTYLALALTFVFPVLSIADTDASAVQVPPMNTVSSQVNSSPTTVMPPPPSAIQYQNTAMPPPINLTSGIQAPLNPKEQRGVTLANQWKNANEMPVRGEDGSVVFVYGSTLPSVVCAPGYECLMRLQAGETVAQLDLGDQVRWEVSPSTYGTGANTTTILVIKAKDSGLQTNMAVATDRRIYNVKLVSRIHDWMPMISFAYPEDINAAWSAYYAKKQTQKEATVIPSTGQNLAKLDFHYRLSGDQPSWRPLRVYNDGLKTYIQFPPSIKSDTTPVLVLVGTDKKTQLVNYRMIGNSYVVDLVVQKAALIEGVGNAQVKVVITHDGSAY